ncbi:hypothetical protein RND71_028436 [Anisodus tanguticus]|uniref:Uncharacterized protein n=1 Tax=Anisodus tanguticus TaxID=243964 RepID=A0AAE1RJN0_9SOLA|nr:hypothetical protein RND71_028436 [Anisodus tanguticus]
MKLLRMSFWWSIVVWFLLIASSNLVESKCAFEAIFNFGDSNTDTGGFYAAFPSQGSPYGMTFFKRPVGRPTDGRVITDFLAQALGLPFVSPYLQSIGSDFRHGANFATSASTVLMPQTSLFVSGVSPFYLDVQLRQFKEFKAKVDASQGKGNTNLPPADIFGKSLYTFYIGQNDFTGNLASQGIGGVKPYLPQVVSQITSTIKLSHDSSDIDEFGCLKSYNNAVVEYNNMLKDALAKTRKELSDANVVYVDTHSVLLELFQHPTSHGLKYGTRACCGHGGGSYNFNQQVFCGNTKEINGQTLSATACEDPYNYVSWDGIHATEAANKQIAQAILSDSHFDPSFSLHKLCDIQPIG